MKVKALCEFKDLQSNRFRREGESFEVTKERADELSATPYGSLIEILESDPEEVEPAQESDLKQVEPLQVTDPAVVEPSQVDDQKVVEPVQEVAPVQPKSKKAKA